MEAQTPQINYRFLALKTADAGVNHHWCLLGDANTRRDHLA